MAAALAAMLLVIVVALLVQRRQSHAPSRELIADGAFKPVDQSQAGTGAGWIQEPTWETAPGSGNAARDPRHERGDTPRPNPPAARNAGTEGGSGLFGERSGERSGPVGERVTSAFGGPPVWASAGSPGDPRPLEPAAMEPAAMEPAAQGTGLHGPPPLRPALGSAELSAVADGTAPDAPDLAGSAPPVSVPLAVAIPEPLAAEPPALDRHQKTSEGKIDASAFRIMIEPNQIGVAEAGLETVRKLKLEEVLLHTFAKHDREELVAACTLRRSRLLRFAALFFEDLINAVRSHKIHFFGFGGGGAFCA